MAKSEQIEFHKENIRKLGKGFPSQITAPNSYLGLVLMLALLLSQLRATISCLSACSVFC